MRFEDWDILLFPGESKVPTKEFKTVCHVLHDSEFAHTNTSFGLPTVSCFIPSLQQGEPFQISIHSWNGHPPISEFTKSYSKYSDSVKFEVRVFINGQFTASTCFDQRTSWPQVIAHSFEFSKNGDLEPLRFPQVHPQLLHRSRWNPAEDLGRIKIIISEGFPRDSPSMPIERLKNVIAFSFQHAPLDVLEDSDIAWPNSGMWRRFPFTRSLPVASNHTEHLELHAHSPRRHGLQQPGNLRFGESRPDIQVVEPNGPVFADAIANQQIQPGHGGVAQPGGAAPSPGWLGITNSSAEGVGRPIGSGNSGKDIRMLRKSNTDISMPDYMPNSTDFTEVPPRFSSHVANRSQGGNANRIGFRKGPANADMRKMSTDESPGDTANSGGTQSSFVPVDLATSLTNSLLHQSMQWMHPQNDGSLRGLSTTTAGYRHLQATPCPTGLSAESTIRRDPCDMHKTPAQISEPLSSDVPNGIVPGLTRGPQNLAVSQEGGCSKDQASADGLKIFTASDSCPGSTASTISSSSEKGPKRGRKLSRGMINEGDRGRASPRPRLAAYVDGEEPTVFA